MAHEEISSSSLKYAVGICLLKECSTWQTLHLSQVIKVNVNSDELCLQYVPLIRCDESGRLFLLISFSPEALTPVYPWEKHQTNPNGGTFYKIPNQCALKMLKSSKIRKVYKNCQSQGDPKETWQLCKMCYPGWEPKTEKGHLVKTKKIWMRYGLYLIIDMIIIYQHWFINFGKCTIHTYYKTLIIKETIVWTIRRILCAIFSIFLQI